MMASQISKRELDTLQDYIARKMDGFASDGWQVYIDRDMVEWAAHMEAAPGITAVTPVFDPRQSSLTPEECFWIRLEDDGVVMGCVCARLFVSSDHIVEDYISQHVWGDRTPPIAPVDILFPRDRITFKGNIVHEGGTWVHPDYRGRNLAGRMNHLIRAVAMREWNVDYYTGTCLEKLFDTGFTREKYGHPHDAPLLDGWCPPMGENRRMHLTWLTRSESFEQIGAEVAREYASA